MASRSLTFACLISAVRRRLADDRGFTIIEVLTSAVLVVIAGLGTFAAFDSAGATSGRNKERTTAAGLAQADQERVRTKTALELAALTDASESTPKTVNDTSYTVLSAATWVTDASGTSSCSGMGDEAGYMRITSTVTWPNMNGLSPVKFDSIKSVPNGGYKTSRGSLAVKVLDRTGLAGVAGVDVTVTGPRNYSATTNSSGCVVLGFVPVGTYNVSISKAGYVEDVLPNAQAATPKTVQVAGEQTASAAFNYDRPGSLGVKYWTRVPGATADVATNGDGFTVANSGLGYPNTRKFGLFTAAATQATRTASTPTTAQKLLFPFTNAYGVWAGTCAQNDPALAANGGPYTPPTASGNGTGLVPANGAVSNVVAFEPMIKVFVNRYTNALPSTTTGLITGQAARVVVRPVVTGCTAAYAQNTVYLATPTTNNGTIADASQPTLPYGQYTVCAQDKATAPTRRVVQTIDNRVRNGTPVTLTLPFAATSPAAC